MMMIRKFTRCCILLIGLILLLANCRSKAASPDMPTVVPAATPTSSATPADTSPNTPQIDPLPRATVSLRVVSDETLTLVNGVLIDGTGANSLPNAVVVVQQGRIIAVGTQAEVKLPDNTKVIDVHGATILPGFINAHVHRGYDKQNLETWAQAGVTTVRDLGASPEAGLFSLRDALLTDSRYARLVAAGPMVTVPDGYPMVPWGVKGLPVDSPEDAARQVNQLLDEGADVIKVALESGVIFKVNIPLLSSEEAAAIVHVAHKRGTRVSAHVTAAPDLGRALEAGVDDIAHMVTTPLRDELIDRMLADDVYWVPTLELWKNVGHGERRAIANLRRFVEAGGKVALGTDYAGYYAEFDLGMPMREIEGMQEAGMTPMQIIVAATQNAAHACNLEHELGTLEPGKIADLLVLDGDPLQDIDALTKVRLVIHNGEIIREPSPSPNPTPAAPAGTLGDTWSRPADGAVMVYVPAGKFKMGSDASGASYAKRLCNQYVDDSIAPAVCRRESYSNEQPVHTVALDAFWIDQTEVTNGQYRRCVAAEACTPPVKNGSYTRDSYYDDRVYDDYPVIWVTWQQAADYCLWAGARLPTEAEWEYAARGPEGLIFPWGNTFDGARLNYCDVNCELGFTDQTVDDGYADTAPVGSFPTGVSWCGALDMAGNVREWVADWYGQYAVASQVNPAGPSSGESRIPRGGSWLDRPDNTRSTNRGANSLDYTRHKVGFRCAGDSG